MVLADLGSDVKFGVHDVQITANIVTRQVGPLMANGSSEYLYLGCYYDGGGRVLAKQFNNATNENGWCQTTCFNAGYQFAGTEYRKYPSHIYQMLQLTIARYPMLVRKHSTPSSQIVGLHFPLF